MEKGLNIPVLDIPRIVIVGGGFAGLKLAKGINSRRLKDAGYGESRPIASNTNEDGSDNPEGRALNRRTEFEIIGELSEDEYLPEQD